MFDSATVTISGNVVADPRVSGAVDNPDRVLFRVVSNRRRRDPQSGEWVNAGEYGVNVVCWRNLARGVARSLRRGDPVVVIGRIAEREYTGDDGTRRWSTEITADFVGHDLAKGASQQFFRFTRLDRMTDTDAQRRADGGDEAADATNAEPDAEPAAEPADEPADEAVDPVDVARTDTDLEPASWPEPQLAGA